MTQLNVKQKKGFTMIEILVVIVILGILATITTINIKINLIKSRDAARKSDLNSIQKALELYQNDHGAYPAGDVGKITDEEGTAITWGEIFKDSKGTIYMNKLPKDSKASPDYCYLSSTPPTSYQIYANLENSNDRNCLTDGCTSTIACGSGLYNYGVSSSNILPNAPTITPTLTP